MLQKSIKTLTTNLKQINNMLNPKTRINTEGKKFHVISGINIACSGQDCNFCKGEIEISFHDWESSIPFPIPAKGKRYKRPSAQKNRGKTIMEICYVCREVPCYICRRAKCDQWMKEKDREGQEAGCFSWENGRCSSFHCELGIIRTNWGENKHGRKRSV